MTRVSVIVPNFNHANFLHQRMESVLGQTLSDIEILFLDDASTDDSLKIAAPFLEDSRVRSVVNETNSGSPFIQWNRGFELATGEYIWIAESDDFADEQLLETLVRILDENPGVGLAYCQSNMVSEDGEDTESTIVESWYESFPESARWKNDYINSGVDELREFIIFKNTIPNASAVVFRRYCLETGLKAPEDMRLAGDWLFWAKILSQADIAYVSKPLNNFRFAHSQTQRSRTISQGTVILEGLSVYEYIARNIGLEPEREALLLNLQLQQWAWSAFKLRFSRAVNKTIYKKIVAVHPEVRERATRLVLLPFIYFFIAVPFKHIPPLVWLIRNVKKAFRLVFGRAKPKLAGD